MRWLPNHSRAQFWTAIRASAIPHPAKKLRELIQILEIEYEPRGIQYRYGAGSIGHTMQLPFYGLLGINPGVCQVASLDGLKKWLLQNRSGRIPSALESITFLACHQPWKLAPPGEIQRIIIVCSKPKSGPHAHLAITFRDTENPRMRPLLEANMHSLRPGDYVVIGI